jgi:hypothetical protein
MRGLSSPLLGELSKEDSMARTTIFHMDPDDQVKTEKLVCELLDLLLNHHRPNLVQDKKVGIRFVSRTDDECAIYSFFDFPEKFERGLSEDSSVQKTKIQIYDDIPDGFNKMEYSHYIGYRLSQLLMICDLRLGLCFAEYGRHWSVCWLRRPATT